MKHILAHIYFSQFFIFLNIFKYKTLPYGIDQKRKKNLNIFFYVSQKTEIKSFGKIRVWLDFAPFWHARGSRNVFSRDWIYDFSSGKLNINREVLRYGFYSLLITRYLI